MSDQMSERAIRSDRIVTGCALEVEGQGVRGWDALIDPSKTGNGACDPLSHPLTGSLFYLPDMLRMQVKRMAKLTAEVKAAMGKVRAFPVATASKAGVPNVGPIGFVDVVDDETIWLADNFMRKTLANVEENPLVSINVWSPETEGCYQVKGEVTIVSEGADFEKMQSWVRAKMAKGPAKNLLVVKVTEVYSCTPGPGAGDKLA